MKKEQLFVMGVACIFTAFAEYFGILHLCGIYVPHIGTIITLVAIAIIFWLLAINKIQVREKLSEPKIFCVRSPEWSQTTHGWCKTSPLAKESGWFVTGIKREKALTFLKKKFFIPFVFEHSDEGPTQIIFVSQNLYERIRKLKGSTCIICADAYTTKAKAVDVESSKMIPLYTLVAMDTFQILTE